MEFENLYNKSLVKELKKLLNMIDDTFSHLKENGHDVSLFEMGERKSKQNKMDWSDYGFYLYSRDEKTIIFIGMWLSYWAQTGNPLTLFLYSYVDNKDRKLKHERLNSYITKRKEIFNDLDEFQEYLNISINKPLFNNFNDYISLIQRVYGFT